MTTTRQTFSQDDVVVRLQRPDGAFDGVLCDSRVEGLNVLVTIDFPHLGSPDLSVGEEVAVAFPHAEKGAEGRVTGKVVMRTEDPFRRRFQLQVGERERAVVASAESRRGPVRVVPSESAPVLVRVEHPDRGVPIAVEVHDISSAGLSLLVKREDEVGLSGEWFLRILLQLPAERGRPADAMELRGNVRYRRLSGDAVQYGIELDAEHTSDFASKQDRLADYVHRRQVEQLAR